MPGAYGQRRLQEAPRRSHSTKEGRTTTYDLCCGQPIVNLSLGWVERQQRGEGKDGKKLPRSGLVQLLIVRHTAV
jgi:hypothetical protein